MDRDCSCDTIHYYGSGPTNTPGGPTNTPGGGEPPPEPTNTEAPSPYDPPTCSNFGPEGLTNDTTPRFTWIADGHPYFSQFRIQIYHPPEITGDNEVFDSNLIVDRDDYCQPTGEENQWECAYTLAPELALADDGDHRARLIVDSGNCEGDNRCYASLNLDACSGVTAQMPAPRGFAKHLLRGGLQPPKIPAPRGSATPDVGDLYSEQEA